MNTARLIIISCIVLLFSVSVSAVVSVFPYTESFETGFGAWSPSPTNDFDWTRITGPTPSSGTGPSGAYDGNWYIYTEASGYNPSNRMAVQAEFDFSTLSNPGLTFYYFMYGNSMGELYVDAFDGVTYSTPWSLAGQQQTSETDPWFKAEVDLSAFAGSSNITIRIRGITGSSFTSDMCVDKVQVFDDIPRIELDPADQSGSALPGGNINYEINLGNKTGGDTGFAITYFNNPWNTLGPVTTGVITNNGSQDLTVQVQVPADVIAGDQATSTVQVISTDMAFTGTAVIVTVASWTYYPLPCETWDVFPDGWTNYALGSPAIKWQQIGFGNPAPGLYHPRYPAPLTNWFVSPAINLSNPFGETINLRFDEIIFNTATYDHSAVLISSGSPNPADGDFVELLDLYDDSGNWVSRNVDITAYKGMNPVYIAFLYISSNAHEIVIDNVCVAGRKIGINDAFFVSPTSAVGMCSQALPPFRGTLYIDGQTGPAGPAEHITAQVGFGTPGSIPGDTLDWQWYPAAYTGPDGIYDAFDATPTPDVAGVFDVAYRFRFGAASWAYADIDGYSNGYDPSKAGYLSILPPDLPGYMVYEQSFDGPAWTFPATAFSNENPAVGLMPADDVILTVDADIHALRWQGQYQDGSQWENMPGFFVRIYANEGSNAMNGFDHPGTALVKDYYYTKACAMLVEDGAYYQYTLPLSTPFHLNRGQKYWFSIQMISISNESAWYIKTTPSLITGSSALYSLGSNWFSLGADLGIEMYGSYTNSGILTGLITSDYNGEPLYNATVAAVGSTNLSVRTLRDGTYIFPLPLGTYDIHASYPNYLTGTVNGLSFTTSGQTREENFTLVGSLLSYGPPLIEEVMHPADIVTNTVTVTNSGPKDISIRIGIAALPDSPFMLPAPAPSPVPGLPVNLPRSDGNFPRGPAAPSIAQAPLSPATAEPARSLMSSTLLAGGGAPAFATEAPNHYLISFNTGNPGSNSVAGTVDSQYIWASDFLPFNLSKLYAIFENNDFIVINPSDGSFTIIGTSLPSPGLSWTGMAGDPDGTLYASATSVSRSELYTIDITDGTPTLIGTISNSPGCIAIAINAQGELYGYDIANDSLISINKTTGAGTIVGSLGFDANYGQGMDFDYESGICYLAAFNNGTFQPELRIADLVTGNTTNVGAFSVNQIGSMAVATLNSPAWAYVSTNQGVIAAGGVSTFDVIFDANAVSNYGTYNAELVFSGTFVNKPPKMPLIMHIADGPMISAPPVLDFGGVYANDLKTLPLPVKNIGFGVITGQLENITAPFGVQGDTNYILASLESTHLATFFAPTGPGPFSQVVPLTGGGGTTVQLTGYTLPTIKTIPASLTFPETEIGNFSEVVIVCRNIGGGVLEGSVSGPALPYTLDGTRDYSLAAMDSTFYTVRFTPTDVGTFTDKLVFTGGGGVEVPITGDAIPEPGSVLLVLVLSSMLVRKKATSVGRV